jgi:ubiquinone/menaquinone biosynthesis C-methylase UbiE
MVKGVKTIMGLVKANGLRWTFLYTFERLFNKRFFYRRIELEIQRKLPGFNTTSYNFKEWSNYNWSQGGEEWSDSEPWKKSLRDEVLLTYIKPGFTVLEIGPGAGRWSITLASISKKLILVDLTESAIIQCKKKLSEFSNCVYFQNDGRSLPYLDDSSIHYVWSHDVFVHISPADTQAYLAALHRVLIKDGVAVIHHPAAGGLKGGFRSSVTNELFCSYLKGLQFQIIRQITQWGTNNEFTLSDYSDIITVFRKC